MKKSQVVKKEIAAPAMAAYVQKGRDGLVRLYIGVGLALPVEAGVYSSVAMALVAAKDAGASVSMVVRNKKKFS